MSSFLISKKESKTFGEKISKLAKKTQSNIYASENSFNRFCLEFYDGRKSGEIFAELTILKGAEQQVGDKFPSVPTPTGLSSQSTSTY